MATVFISVSQPFLVRGTLNKLYRYLAAPLDGQIGIKIKKLYYLAALKTPVRGIPVRNNLSIQLMPPNVIGPDQN